METLKIDEVQTILPWFLKHDKVWADYDKEADVLYIHFRKPGHADNTEMTDDDIIIRYEKGVIIGFTILNASNRDFKIPA
jgi:uncharacterized protein YuzE